MEVVFLKTNLILEWVKTNKLNLKTNKTKLMQCAIIHQNYTLSIIYVRKNKLESIEEVKILGVVLGANLNFQCFKS